VYLKMCSLTKNQLGQECNKNIVVQCDVPQLDFKYPHEVAFCNNKRRAEKHIKIEPTSFNDFDENSVSSVVDHQYGGNCSFVDDGVHGLVKIECDNVNAAKVGFVNEMEDSTSYRHHSSVGKEQQSFSVAVKEENLSDEDVIDVYPAGVEIARTWNEPQSTGIQSNYNMVNFMESNGIINNRQGKFDDEEDSVEKVSDGVFVGEVGAEVGENGSIEIRKSHKCFKPFVLTVGSDQVGRQCDVTDIGHVVEEGGIIDGECVMLGDAGESQYIYLVEASGNGSESGDIGDPYESKGSDVMHNFTQIVPNRVALDRVSGIGNRNLSLAEIPTVDTQDVTQYLYYEVDASDCEDGKSDHSMYEPSSNESDSDVSTVSNDSKRERYLSKGKCSSNVERKQKRLPNQWKVERTRCKICCCFFPTKQDLSTHTCVASSVSCTTCGRRLKDFDSLQRHEKVHLDMKPYSCEICGKGFREKNNLTTHKRTHTKEMPYQCDHCSKRFADPSNFNRHRKSHLGIAIAKPCKCKFCGERFSRTANLLRHLVRFHKGEPAVLVDDLEIGMEAEVASKFKKLACNYCGKKFGKKETLQTHELLHSECKALTCKHCHRLLSSKDGLIRHLKIHGVEVDGKPSKSFVCNYCGASFQSKASLTSHERTHKKEWLHTCTICNARFTLKTSLNRHLQIHSGNKPHGCDICDKRFLRAYDLTIHKRIHSKERPYRCGTCGRSFAAQTNFCKHSKLCEAKTVVD